MIECTEKGQHGDCDVLNLGLRSGKPKREARAHIECLHKNSGPACEEVHYFVEYDGKTQEGTVKVPQGPSHINSRSDPNNADSTASNKTDEATDSNGIFEGLLELLDPEDFGDSSSEPSKVEARADVTVTVPCGSKVPKETDKGKEPQPKHNAAVSAKGLATGVGALMSIALGVVLAL